MGSLKAVSLESVLVVGGSGFIGFHIVRHFLQEPGTSVSVVSRNPWRNALPGVSYHIGDVSKSSSMRDVVLAVQPTVIVHAACPPMTSASAKTYEKIIVKGTRDLLAIAADAPSVKAFIYTSSATGAAGSEHIDLDETTPLADTYPGSHPYARTKAQADKMVVTANNPNHPNDNSGLLTACIRLPIVYGERDLLSIPGALAVLEKKQTWFQLGDGTNMWDFCSADNAAMAHVLLAKALLASQGNPKVDGEAFNITDGERHRFWDFPRTIWKAAGWEPQPNARTQVLPTGLAMIVAIVLEWLFMIFTLGTRRPSLLSKQQVEYSCFTHTYRIDKAKERLGYAPVAGFEDGISKSVHWSLDHDGWAARLENCDINRPKCK